MLALVELTAARFLPLTYAVAALLLGVAAERFAVAQLRAALIARRKFSSAALLDSLGGMLTVFVTCLGVHATLLAYHLRPAVLDASQKSVTAIMSLAVTLVAARIAGRFIDGYLQRHREALPSASLFTSLARIAVFSIGALIALGSLGVSIAPVLTALGVGGLAVALALKDTLENLFAGLQIIASRQVRPGDYIKLDDGSEGYVADITWRNTTIRELSNNLVVVPNVKLAQSTFTNFSLPEHALSVAVPVLVPYDADLARVERASLDEATMLLAELGTPVTAPAPFVRFAELANENVKMTVFLRASEFVDQFRLRSDYLKRLHARLRRDAIAAPFPARTALPPPLAREPVTNGRRAG